jgi:hypothetical protein
MTVEFVCKSGAVKSIDFRASTTGFALALARSGCFGFRGQGRVMVEEVEWGGQAWLLGVKRSWVVKSVCGTEVTSLQQAGLLLALHAARLPAVHNVL